MGGWKLLVSETFGKLQQMGRRKDNPTISTSLFKKKMDSIDGL